MPWQRMLNLPCVEVWRVEFYCPKHNLISICLLVYLVLHGYDAVIEKYTKNTRFALICNHVNKIIPALQSRCTRFRFAPLDAIHVSERLKHVIRAEGWVPFTTLCGKFLVFAPFFPLYVGTRCPVMKFFVILCSW